MSQYKIGKVLAVNGSAVVTSNNEADWTDIGIGDLFAIPADRAIYAIANVAQASAPSAYSSGSTYNPGDLVTGTDTYYYVAITGVPVSTPPPNTSYWMRTSLWQLTLDTLYPSTTKANSAYAISVDFTPNFSLPMIQPGDVETGSLLTRALTKVDDLMVPLAVPGVPDLLSFRDDFTHSIGPSNLGELGWELYQNNGSYAGIWDSHPDAQNHPGALLLNNTGWTHAHLASNDLPTIPMASDFDAMFIFAATIANTELFLGFGSSTSTFPDLHALGIFYSSSYGANYQYYSRDNDSVSYADSNKAAVLDIWHRVRIRRVPGQARVAFSLDGGAEQIVTSNLPLSRFLTPTIWIKSLTGANVYVYVDYASFAMKGFVR